MSNSLDFELLKQLYPEEFEELLAEKTAEKDKLIAFYEKELTVFAKFHDLIVESAKINEGRDWFIDTGNWYNIMDYMLKHPESWLKDHRKVLKILKKKQEKEFEKKYHFTEKLKKFFKIK